MRWNTWSPTDPDNSSRHHSLPPLPPQTPPAQPRAMPPSWCPHWPSHLGVWRQNPSRHLSMWVFVFMCVHTHMQRYWLVPLYTCYSILKDGICGWIRCQVYAVGKHYIMPSNCNVSYCMELQVLWYAYCTGRGVYQVNPGLSHNRTYLFSSLQQTRAQKLLQMSLEVCPVTLRVTCWSSQYWWSVLVAAYQ